MISLSEYVFESLGNLKLSEADKNKLLALDKWYYDVNIKFREYRPYILLNLEEEYEKFIKAYNAGAKYFPVLEHKPCPWGEELVKDMERLYGEFGKFDCFLSKYYLECLYHLIGKARFYCGIDGPSRYVANEGQTPSLELYEKALQIIKSTKYKEPDKSDRNITDKEAKKMIEDHIKKLGYEWDVVLDPGMLPRMAVHPQKKMFIRPGATFSKDDIEGLKVHEIEAHIGRRYYGLKTGLYLFNFGLLWNIDLDEGLAIWNSLNKVDEPKPNIMLNIAMKTVQAYQLDKMDFCELFDFCHKLVPEKDTFGLFQSLCRFKRELCDCSIKGGNGDDASYLRGYCMVDKMSDEERNDILKYNIGPGQLEELDDIKKFLQLNKFKPLI